MHNSGYIDPSKLRIGQLVRVKRPLELQAPEWNQDTSSNGRFWINYSKHRVIDTGILGEEYIIDVIQAGTDEILAYQEYEVNGAIHRTSNTILYNSLIAEILSPMELPTPKCNCGKDITGRRDPGAHSTWCNVTLGYVSIRDRS